MIYSVVSYDIGERCSVPDEENGPQYWAMRHTVHVPNLSGLIDSLTKSLINLFGIIFVKMPFKVFGSSYLCIHAVVRFPDKIITKEFTSWTDASNRGIWAGFVCKSVMDCSIQFSIPAGTIEHEGLPIIWAIDELHWVFVSKEFVFETDHNASIASLNCDSFRRTSTFLS